MIKFVILRISRRITKKKTSRDRETRETIARSRKWRQGQLQIQDILSFFFCNSSAPKCSQSMDLTLIGHYWWILWSAWDNQIWIIVKSRRKPEGKQSISHHLASSASSYFSHVELFIWSYNMNYLFPIFERTPSPFALGILLLVLRSFLKCCLLY